MKKILFVLLIFGLTPLLYGQENLRAFNKEFEKEQVVALDKAVISFQKFLALNYGHQDTVALRTAMFLKEFQEIDNKDSTLWKFPKDIRNVLFHWEKSGLRNEIRLWPNENYKHRLLPDYVTNDTNYNKFLEDIFDDEIIPLYDRNGNVIEPLERDSALYFNRLGDYIYALNECCESDTLVKEYINIKLDIGEISLSSMAGGINHFYMQRQNDPILMRMIVVELYYWIMKSELE